MKKITVVLLTVLAVLTAQAELMINVDLGAGTSVGTGTAGAVASDGWQQKSAWPDFTNLSLLYADGSASGATISGDGSGNITSIGASTADGNYSMFNRMLGIEGSANFSTLTVNNLNMGGAYDVYVYLGSAANTSADTVNTFSVSDGTTTYYLEMDETQASYQGIYIQATATDAGSSVLANYVKFSGLTASTFTISAQNADNVTASAAGFAGIQIVQATVPEPATVGMVAVGFAMTLLVRRCRDAMVG